MILNVPFKEILDTDLCSSIDTKFKKIITKSNIDTTQSYNKIYKDIVKNIKFLLKKINELQVGKENNLIIALQQYFHQRYDYSYIVPDLKYTNENIIYKNDTSDDKLKFTLNNISALKPYMREDVYWTNENDIKTPLPEIPNKKLKEILTDNYAPISYSGQSKYLLQDNVYLSIKSYKAMAFNSFGASISDTYKMLDTIDLSDIFSEKEEKLYIDLQKSLIDTTILLFWILDNNHIKRVMEDNLFFPSVRKTNHSNYTVSGENIAYIFFGMIKVIWQDLQSFYYPYENKIIGDILNINVNNLNTIIMSMKYSYDFYEYSRNKIKEEYNIQLPLYVIYDNSDDIEYVFELFQYITSTDIYFLDNNYKDFILEMNRRNGASVDNYWSNSPYNKLYIQYENGSSLNHDIYNGFQMNNEVTFTLTSTYDYHLTDNIKYQNDIDILNYDLTTNLNNLDLSECANKILYYNGLLNNSDEKFLNLYKTDIVKIINILTNIINT
jgi:hypothetical protein